MNIRDRLLDLTAASLHTRLDERQCLVRHESATRRSVLFRHEVYDVSQATPLYWMLLQWRGDRQAEQKLVTGLKNLTEHLSPLDHNAGFRALFLLVYWHFWGGSLTAEAQALLRTAIRTAIDRCLERGKRAAWIEIAYTNFWIIEATVYTLGGALLDDARLRRRGGRMLREMHRDHSRLEAMDEFFSPTYTVVDLVATAILKAAAPPRNSANSRGRWRRIS